MIKRIRVCNFIIGSVSQVLAVIAAIARGQRNIENSTRGEAPPSCLFRGGCHRPIQIVNARTDLDTPSLLSTPLERTPLPRLRCFPTERHYDFRRPYAVLSAGRPEDRRFQLAQSIQPGITGAVATTGERAQPEPQRAPHRGGTELGWAARVGPRQKQGRDRAQRDAHLRSPDFLDVEHHPEIRFRSRRIEPLGEGRYRVVGDLTIRGVAREVALEVEETGRTRDPWGNDRIGYVARTAINRHDWGVSWNQLLEAGGVVVGDEVKIEIEGELMRAAAQQAA